MYSPVQKLMERFGLHNRQDYIAINWCGDRDPDGELGGEEESELPAEYQRQALDENELTDKEQ